MSAGICIRKPDPAGRRAMEIDVRGLDCPQPVIKTRQALEDSLDGSVTVIVDNSATRDNVKRFAESQGCSVSIEERNGEFSLKIVKGPPVENTPQTPGVIAYVESDTMGRGSEELGKILMRAFLKTVPEITPGISKLIFINNGVRLTTEGSDLIETLKDLEDRGIEIFSCGTCLDFFHLLDKVKVGKVSNMFEIVTMLANSDRIIKP